MRKSDKREREGGGGGGRNKDREGRRWNKKTVEKGVASISGELVEEERARYLFLFRG